MDNQNDEIERKLIELESSIPKKPENTLAMPVTDPSSDLKKENYSVQSDLSYFAGIALVITGILLLFQHIRVGTGFLAWMGWGGQGFGLLLVPLLVGLGWIMYDAKHRAGWIILAVSCAVICFSVLSSLVMTFPMMSLLGLIILLFPFAAGGALILKGLGGLKGLQNKLK